MLRTRLCLIATAALLSVPLLAYAQQPSPADPQFKAAMDKMHQSMEMATNADPALSYAKKMIVHHQGALEISGGAPAHARSDHSRDRPEDDAGTEKGYPGPAKVREQEGQISGPHVFKKGLCAGLAAGALRAARAEMPIKLRAIARTRRALST